MPPLSLHHLTVLDASHSELVDIAARLGCPHVCVFVRVPPEHAHEFPAVAGTQDAKVLRRHLDDAGVSVWNLEAFYIQRDMDLSAYRRALEIGAILGARGATAINFHPDPMAAAERLAELAGLAAEFGLTVGLEWIKPSATRTLRQAADLMRRCGAANVKLTVDPLHLMRNGGAPKDLLDLPPSVFGYTQICDGPAELPEDEQWHEMISARMVPGEGEFPLVAYLRSLPPELVLAIEVPQASLIGVVPAMARAATLVAATRKLLAEV